MPQLPLGFLEHAQWQHTSMHAKRLADLEWWLEQLKGATPLPLLATDYARSGKANIGQNPGSIVKVCKLPWSADMICRLQSYNCYKRVVPSKLHMTLYGLCHQPLNLHQPFWHCLSCCCASC